MSDPAGSVVVDTSALMAILMEEPSAARVSAALEAAGDVAILAGTWVECMVVAHRRGIPHRMRALLDSIAPTMIPVDREAAERADAAFARYGKGLAPAGLNFGDLFAYDAAASRGAALLFVGEDFTRTDVRAALA